MQLLCSANLAPGPDQQTYHQFREENTVQLKPKIDKLIFCLKFKRQNLISIYSLPTPSPPPRLIASVSTPAAKQPSVVLTPDHSKAMAPIWFALCVALWLLAVGLSSCHVRCLIVMFSESCVALWSPCRGESGCLSCFLFGF